MRFTILRLPLQESPSRGSASGHALVGWRLLWFEIYSALVTDSHSGNASGELRTDFKGYSLHSSIKKRLFSSTKAGYSTSVRSEFDSKQQEKHQSRRGNTMKLRSSGPLNLQATVSSQSNYSQSEASRFELRAANRPGWRKPGQLGALICRRMVT